MQLLLDRYESPLGQILLITDANGLVRALDYADYESRMRRLIRLHFGDSPLVPGSAPAAIILSLDAYFAGDFTALDSIATAAAGTNFQRDVWRALRAIPPGTTQTYGQLGVALGRPTAARAVGAANGANPIAIIVPCHRVVGSAGALTGYAGGLARKEWLLRHERAAFLADPARPVGRELAASPSL